MSPFEDPSNRQQSGVRLEKNLWWQWRSETAGVPDAAAAELRRYLAAEDTWFARRHAAHADLRVAYFSAEFAVADALRIYAGGLGVLAGDHLKSASDLGVPLVGVGLLYREGYFTQEIDSDGIQRALYPAAEPESLPLALETGPDGAPLLVEFPLLDRRCHACIWRADVGRVPLYLLDTDVPVNTPADRRITDRLYGGDIEHRLQQEIVLGIGGMRALAALGCRPAVLHLNEGHAALAAVERVRQATGERHGLFRTLAEELRDGVIFTTHTPVPAGHDTFPPDLLERHLGGYTWEMREPWDCFLALGHEPGVPAGAPFNMTYLALRMSGRHNGVSRLHGAVSRRMFQALWPDLAEDDVPIGHVTNGVHLDSWVAPTMAGLFAEHIGPEWRTGADELHWHRAAHIPLDELWAARAVQRSALVARARALLEAQVARRGDDPAWTARALDPDALTIGFARRFATYKRATLLLSDPDRLARLLASGRVQFLFAGKAHPRDEPGQEVLRRIFEFAQQPGIRERFVFLEDYDATLARYLVSGADVWINVPRRPREASGTSGMKAAANGALNLSIPDGWWAEAWTDHNAGPFPIGWSIDTPEAATAEEQDRNDADALFSILEHEVVPIFESRRADGVAEQWTERIRCSIRQVVPFFNTARMVREYVEELYLPAFVRSRSGLRGDREIETAG